MILRKAFWMRISVMVSIFEVASSKMSMGGSASMTRAMHKSCRSPCEMLTLPESTVSYPCSKLRIKKSQYAAFAAASTCSRVAFSFP